jgi:cell division protein FtsW (lipid II flippase)
VFYLGYFLWQGVTYLLDEREIRSLNRRASSSKQRITIILFHLTAFFILAYQPGTFLFNKTVLIMGGAVLIFLIGAMMLTSLVYRKSCLLLWNGVFLLMDISFVTLYRLEPDVAERQLLFAVIGFSVSLLVPMSFTLTNKFKPPDFVYLIISLALLSLPFFIGNRSGGSLNWIVIKNVQFQPSEIVKFFFIFYLAAAFTKKRSIPQLLLSAFFTSVIILVLVIQRDLGGALIFFMTYMSLMYIWTGRAWLFFTGMGFASCGAWLASKMFSHVHTRISIWQNPWNDPFNSGLQILQSLFAINTWGIFGSGLTLGVPRYVPVVTSDFIFAAICEEFGGLFGLLLMGIYVMIFYRGVNIALRSLKLHNMFLTAGFTSILTFQTFLILGGVIKFIPLTGVTLPFVSAGGSSIVVCIVMIGILQSVMRDNQKEKEDDIYSKTAKTVPPEYIL